MTSMSFANVVYEKRGSTGWLALDRPDDMNALDPATVGGVSDALAAAAEDKQVRALVLTGTGRAFCAGADLKFIKSALKEGVKQEMVPFLDRFSQMCDRLENFPQPTIAAVNGLALAGGLELLLCCDLVIAADSARIGDAHANFGLIPGGGSSARLPRKIGPTRAKYLLFTGEFVPAADLVEAGLVNEVVPDAELESAATALAEKLAGKSPLSLRRVKTLVNDGWDQPLNAALRAELEAFMAHGESSDMREGLAAFVEKRTPEYTGE
jgi:enoyl-CoA hydratase/carnithine racemase